MATKSSSVYVGENTHVVEVVGLKDHEDNVQTDAVVTLVSIVDKATGEELAGVNVPCVLTHIGEGLYQERFTAEFVVGGVYEATITAVSSSGIEAEWSETLVAKKRRA
jgi:hypothetical protein